MKELSKQYSAAEVEDAIYKRWESSGYFHPENLPFPTDALAYTISMPPPNATGILHSGHALFLTIEDAMIRFERMNGKRALWVPGTDHAAIATQSRVEKMIMEKEGKTRYDLGREEMVSRIKEFVKTSQGTIRNQIRKMGASCDWEREEYTFSDRLSYAVKKVFVDLYNEGLIYRGKRIVNWDPNLQTTVSDDEVEYVEEDGILYYIQYGPFVVATSRPETKLGDTAVAVNPNDERYTSYIGKTIDVEFTRGHKISVKVIASDAVDPEFGTGALGVTPGHSLVDYDMAVANGLAMPQVIDLNGKMTSFAGPYEGMDIFECRKKFVEDLRESGKLVKEEKYVQSVSHNSRGGGIIEPQIIEQWFVDVNKEVILWKEKKQSFKHILKDVVDSGDIKIVPERFSNVYFHWIDNLRDWCVSRQIWWGHDIPAWYDSDGNIKVSIECPGEGWKQDSDTLDTWFSSALWPFATLGWPDTKHPDYEKYFPTQVMETGYDILFFWVARMILMSSFATGKVPFYTVYLHGLVRDEHGRKMSKSLGNVTDPIDVINKYGTDALRLALVIGTTPGNDSKIGEQKIESCRNFVNKIWNIARFTLMQEGVVGADMNSIDVKSNADAWILNRLNNSIKEVTDYYGNYNFSLAGETAYQFLWDDFANWYLEVYKVASYPKNPAMLRHVLETCLKLLHPLMPFVTEEIWSYIYGTGNEKMLMIQSWPKIKSINQSFDTSIFVEIRNSVIRIRNERAEAKVNPADILEASVVCHPSFIYDIPVLEKLARIKVKSITESEGEKNISVTTSIDTSRLEEQKKKRKNELEKYISLLEKKLGNAEYIANAPDDIVEKDRENLAKSKEELENSI